MGPAVGAVVGAVVGAGVVVVRCVVVAAGGAVGAAVVAAVAAGVSVGGAAVCTVMRTVADGGADPVALALGGGLDVAGRTCAGWLPRYRTRMATTVTRLPAIAARTPDRVSLVTRSVVRTRRAASAIGAQAASRRA